ncbi:Nif3-like dinuclear metal center hexameric protein [Paenibacillus lycopersici]|uniref:GTP cyclohydrolase 1 type 2 homolog n=1 Tax=Paenibacillus lycopersici TaxID=2704462 RepID=A0A6C0FV10_9BACL|nr:Nif3-like dinuclear metal center hexameric protein [Paenibacillus lycopersici]QHT59872.1 Nif3-like dinuclear metal center hexameric protein [Paenibacillus lycopersici]
MTFEQFRAYMFNLFGHLFTDFEEKEEYGFHNFSLDYYERIGYSTNITPEIVLQAASNDVQLIITHHDAWNFVYGMKEECIRLLREYKIAHFFVHLPLDYSDFGTCNSMFRALGINNIVQQSHQYEGRSAIGIGEYDSPLSLEKLIEKMKSVLGESVYVQKNNDKEIRRVGMITGAGNGTNQLREALNNNCDVYITGEKTLYSVQYAKFINMNMIVGSHTFTEIFGVEALAKKLKSEFKEINLSQLYEEHIEVIG